MASKIPFARMRKLFIHSTAFGAQYMLRWDTPPQLLSMGKPQATLQISTGRSCSIKHMPHLRR